MAGYLYRNSLSEARRCDELQLWRDSYKENIRCRDNLDKMVSEQYNGNILPDEIIKTACEEFGIDRVGWVLANTVNENDYDGRYRPDTKKWARTTFYIPNDIHNCEFELRTHPELVNGMVGQYRKYLSEELGILSQEACLPNSNEDDYTDKLLILHTDALAEDYKKGEYQYFYANGGNGCRPTSLGRKIFGFFVSDGEKTQFVRGDFIGIADPEQVPDWVNEKLAVFLEEQQNTEEGGLTLT